MNAKHTSVKVLIANPNSMTCELLMRALKKYRQFHVISSVTTAHDVLEAVQSKDVEVALITANLAEGPLSGFGVLRQLHDSFPDVKIVILFDAPESNLVVDAFRAGARGVFVLSSSTFKSLCRCVESVRAGQIWASSSELAEVMDAFSQVAPVRVVNTEGMRLLTRREEDVVRLLAEGLQNREIANELKLSEHTVKNYLFHIFDKLGVSSRVELVLYAVSSVKKMQVVSARSGIVQIEPGISSTDDDQRLRASAFH